jgi:uncharacterized phage protein gp47/JayE
VPITPPVLLTDDEQIIFDRALAEAATLLPSWIPRSGNQEVALLEVFATMLAETRYALDQVPAADLGRFLATIGVPRHDGVAAIGTLAVRATAALGISAPAGSRFQIGVGGPVVESLGAIVVAADATVQVPVRTVLRSADTPSTLNQSASALSAMPGFRSAVVSTVLNGGSGPETEAQWIARASNRLARLSDTIVDAEQAQALALEQPGIARAKGINLYRHSVAGTHPGYATVAVIRAGGVAPTTTELGSLRTSIEARSTINLTVEVMAAPVRLSAVTITLTTRNAYVPSEVEDAVIATVLAKFGPESVEWGSPLYESDLSGVVDQVPGVNVVQDVSIATTPSITPVDLVVVDPAQLIVIAT